MDNKTDAEQHLEAAKDALNELHTMDRVVGHVLCGGLSLAILWARRIGVIE